MSFYDLWEKTNVSTTSLAEAHSYTIGDDSTTPVFPRFEAFMAAEPVATPVFEGPLPKFLGYDDDGNVLSENAMPELTHAPEPEERRDRRGNLRTFCGASLSPRRPARDEWKEWQRAKAKHLLGGGRIARTGRGYTVFPEDVKVNRDILGVANKYVGAHFDPETRIPCEDFRDLCNHLALNGVRRFADGTFSTYYLEEEAHAYLRKTETALSISNQHLKPRTQK